MNFITLPSARRSSLSTVTLNNEGSVHTFDIGGVDTDECSKGHVNAICLTKTVWRCPSRQLRNGTHQMFALRPVSADLHGQCAERRWLLSYPRRWMSRRCQIVLWLATDALRTRKSCAGLLIRIMSFLSQVEIRGTMCFDPDSKTVLSKAIRPPRVSRYGHIWSRT